MSAVHPSDQLYALERAIAACSAIGEPTNVISDLRAMWDQVQREARGGVNPVSQTTGD